MALPVLYARCAGLDVHKKMIVACLLIVTAQGVEKEIQTFSTMLPDLYRLRDWLKARQCTAVANVYSSEVSIAFSSPTSCFTPRYAQIHCAMQR